MTVPSPADHAKKSRAVNELLTSLTDAPLSEHPDIYAEVHAKLQQRLTLSEQAER